jgi:beta-aspartyl-peptidase (threonine type)
MEKSEHVFLSSTGADEFARVAGCETADPSYFLVDSRIQQLKYDVSLFEEE